MTGLAAKHYAYFVTNNATRSFWEKNANVVPVTVYEIRKNLTTMSVEFRVRLCSKYPPALPYGQWQILFVECIIAVRTPSSKNKVMSHCPRSNQITMATGRVLI